MQPQRHCPDCETIRFSDLTRRQFVRSVGATAALASATSLSVPVLGAGTKSEPASEPLVKKLYTSLTADQKKQVCFDWNHRDEDGLLRSFVSANWNITKPRVASSFFTRDQQDLIEAIYFGLYRPDWHDRIRKQLHDDAGGYGKQQSIAIFGNPESGQFEFVMTGRHLTIRCDGDSTEHAAFGGPIFYGHAAQGFNEKPEHPGNVFWHQAVKANKLYSMLDGKQRKLALVAHSPEESSIQFRPKADKPLGIPVSELTPDQKASIQEVLAVLVEPYRTNDSDEALRCLKAQGGLDRCSIAFFQSDDEGKSLDLGNDGVWDVWRLEGPSFVWHYRGAPHVHVWVNVASDPSVKIISG